MAESAVAQARSSLASGRHGEALEAVRRARRRRGAEGGVLALHEADALFGLQRHREALGVVSRALKRPPTDADVATRLRIARGQALWLTGHVRPGTDEVQRAAEGALSPLTRARGLEALGLFAWKGLDLHGAEARLAEAGALYADAGFVDGRVRVLGKQAGVLRDAGRLEDALVVQARRIATAAEGARADTCAIARNDRGGLLAAMGRWAEARQEMDRAAELFRHGANPREHTVAGVNRAALDLAAGDLTGARDGLRQAAEALRGDHGDPRPLGEVLLLMADLHGTAGETALAERAAVEALTRFASARDREGICRSRVRRCHALLGLGRGRDAVREGHRAVRAAAATRPDLGALAALALGRALLRVRPDEAAVVFDRALAFAHGRPNFVHAGRLGRTLARGAGRNDEDVRLGLSSLELWGDRRLLALCLADLQEVRGVPRSVGVVASPAGSATPSGEGLVEAAVALAAEGDWGDRLAAALHAIRPALAWFRAAVVGEPGWEARADLDRPVPLPPLDLARDLAANLLGPAVVDLSSEGWRTHPTRVLHALGSAVVAPVEGGAVLYFDRRDDQPAFGPHDVAIVAQLARLLAGHPPGTAASSQAGTRFPEIVGRCPPMEGLFAQMSRFASADVWVHVYGETGTGKEKVAEALHRHSARRGRPFVAWNASSLSDDLFEAELFGHARGAFTGAAGEREGLVAEADGGTLFIDEVADLSLRAQAKLLRFLSDGEYRRVGETKRRRADIRLLSAANVRLRDRVAEGRFREDLVYRLAPVTIEIPPLRERGDDVLLLAQHFLREMAAREGGPRGPLPREVARALRAHPWPGNVRELLGEVRRLVACAGTGPLLREHLSPQVLGGGPRLRSSLREAQASFERDYIRAALSRNGGNRARTALALGVTRQALLGKMNRLGV